MLGSFEFFDFLAFFVLLNLFWTFEPSFDLFGPYNTFEDFFKTSQDIM